MTYNRLSGDRAPGAQGGIACAIFRSRGLFPQAVMAS